MSELKCPFCESELKQTSLYMDGNHQFTHKHVGALEGGKDRCPLDGETLHYRGWQALIQAKQDLKQSEKCCSVWETQALDYKAETIALSGKLEIAQKALEEISSHYQDEMGKPTFVNWYLTAKKMCDCADKALEQIGHKEQQ